MGITRYYAETESVKHEKGWNTLKVSIFSSTSGTDPIQIGEYERNYGNLYDTFHPFKQGDKEYALYSRHYTATRVMTLPDCKDLCGEEPRNFGFCPTGYYVPEDDPDEDDPDCIIGGKFGFVSGCVWGDDTSWKIQHLDLSQIEQGVIKRSAKLGYIELLNSQSLKDAIDCSNFDWEDQRVDIACRTSFYFGHDYP